ncbi:DUF308 domain-containing protein [Opitutales bacterium]|nr:DUF308 domain-containing protein [Opitutales bacterium]
MKIIQDSPTYLECKKSALFGYIFSIILMVGGVIGVIVMFMKSSSQWWIGLIALAIGILILFLTKSITLIADGNIKQVKIATKSLLGASDNAYAFHDIKEIVIEEDRQYERDSDGNRKDKTSFVLIFNFHNGYQEAINLTSGSSSSISVGGVNMSRFSQNNAVMNIGQRLSEVIVVPFNHKRRGDMDLGDVVNSVGQVIKQVKQANQDNQNPPQA